MINGAMNMQLDSLSDDEVELVMQYRASQAHPVSPEGNAMPATKPYLPLIFASSLSLIVGAVAGFSFGVGKGVEWNQASYDSGVTNATTNAKVRRAASSADAMVLATEYLGRFYALVDQPVITGNTAQVTANILGQQCALTMQRPETTDVLKPAEWLVTQTTCKGATNTKG